MSTRTTADPLAAATGSSSRRAAGPRLLLLQRSADAPVLKERLVRKAADGVKGGVFLFRGTGIAARRYLEADRAHGAGLLNAVTLAGTRRRRTWSPKQCSDAKPVVIGLALMSTLLVTSSGRG